jgi:hypothetical protein
LHTPLDPSETHVETYAQRYPFTYASEDMPDLLRSIERNHHDPARVVDSRARQFVRTKGATGTLKMLRQMTANIHDEFTSSRATRGALKRRWRRSPAGVGPVVISPCS